MLLAYSYEIGLVANLIGLYRMQDAKNKDEWNVTKAEAQTMRFDRLVDKAKKASLNH